MHEDPFADDDPFASEEPEEPTTSTHEVEDSASVVPMALQERIHRLKVCLRVNHDFKAAIAEQLSAIERAQDRNQREGHRLKELMRAGARALRARRLIPKPGHWFVDEAGTTPPVHEHAAMVQELATTAPTRFKVKPWTTSQVESLRAGVRLQNQQHAMSELLARCNEHADQEVFNRELQRMERVSPEELERDTSNINWDMVARAISGRSAREARTYWLHHLDPQVNRANWTRSEDKTLRQLVAELGGYSWETIAQRLGTNRLPLQCFQRWQRSLNPRLQRSKWTKEEDDLLEMAVEKYGTRRWTQVASELPRRTSQQCLHRWNKSLGKKNMRKGRWWIVEDTRLVLACVGYGYIAEWEPVLVDEEGGEEVLARLRRRDVPHRGRPGHGDGQSRICWVDVAQHVPTRTDVQCRERFVNALRPATKHSKWTEEETAHLLRLVEEHGPGSWALVSSHVPGRTDNQCYRQWRASRPDEHTEYAERVATERAVLPKNFVGRRKARPELTADDVPEDDPAAQEARKAVRSRLSDTTSEKRSRDHATDASADEPGPVSGAQVATAAGDGAPDPNPRPLQRTRSLGEGESA